MRTPTVVVTTAASMKVIIIASTCSLLVT